MTLYNYYSFSEDQRSNGKSIRFSSFFPDQFTEPITFADDIASGCISHDSEFVAFAKCHFTVFQRILMENPCGMRVRIFARRRAIPSLCSLERSYSVLSRRRFAMRVVFIMSSIHHRLWLISNSVLATTTISNSNWFLIWGLPSRHFIKWRHGNLRFIVQVVNPSEYKQMWHVLRTAEHRTNYQRIPPMALYKQRQSKAKKHTTPCNPSCPRAKCSY